MEIGYDMKTKVLMMLFQYNKKKYMMKFLK